MTSPSPGVHCVWDACGRPAPLAAAIAQGLTTALLPALPQLVVVGSDPLGAQGYAASMSEGVAAAGYVAKQVGGCVGTWVP